MGNYTEREIIANNDYHSEHAHRLRLSSLTFKVSIVKRIDVWLGAVVLMGLLLRFAPYFPNGSPDYILHFTLIDEIMQAGRIAPDAIERISVMALYPPISHWIAALGGWMFGSGLVGISLVTVAAAFFSWLLAARIVADTPVKLALFLGAFLLLKETSSLVGWEVVNNFFYPQLVGDALYFLVLWYLLATDRIFERSVVFIAAGIVAMWLQPLNAVQIVGAGCTLLAVEAAKLWRLHRVLPLRYALAALVAVVVAGIAIVAHPEFALMREIATNNGALEFRYHSILLVAAGCAALCALNAVRYVFFNGERADAIVSSAGLAACALTLAQFLAWKYHGDGSPYAIKKHMFIVMTVGMMNAVRLVAAFVDRFPRSGQRVTAYATPFVAAYVSTFVLQGFTQPLAPTVRALAYARQIAAFQFPKINEQNTVLWDEKLPLLSNALVSRIAFRHQLNYQWWAGMKITEGVQYSVVRRTAASEMNCPHPYAMTDEYVVVDTPCLSLYRLGETLDFSSAGNGRQYEARGWSFAEPWGTWALARPAAFINLTLPANTNGPLELAADTMAYISKSHDRQTVIVEVNGRDVATWQFDQASATGIRTAIIPSELVIGRKLNIVLKAPTAVTPRQDGGPPDDRLLGIGLKTLIVRAAS